MKSTKRLVMIAMFVALVIVGGFISVPIPFTDVQLSFQTVFVIAAGLILGSRDGALAVVIYVTMGLIGIPVFTQGGGIGYVLMPSFGYLLGFPLGAAVTGAINKRLKKVSRGGAFFAALIGMLPIYAIGMSYQVLIVYLHLGKSLAAALGGLPAIVVLAVKDAILCGFTSALYPALHRAMRAMGMVEKRGAKGYARICERI